jgi:hypothetical protein
MGLYDNCSVKEIRPGYWIIIDVKGNPVAIRWATKAAAERFLARKRLQFPLKTI